MLHSPEIDLNAGLAAAQAADLVSQGPHSMAEGLKRGDNILLGEQQDRCGADAQASGLRYDILLLKVWQQAYQPFGMAAGIL